MTPSLVVLVICVSGLIAFALYANCHRAPEHDDHSTDRQ
jgi:hypothetical protein